MAAKVTSTMVLSKKERIVMGIIFDYVSRKGRAILAPEDILIDIPLGVKFTEEELSPMIEGLKQDGYFDCTIAKRKGDDVYVFELRDKGLAFARELARTRKGLWLMIGMTAGTAVLGFLIKLILDAILH